MNWPNRASSPIQLPGYIFNGRKVLEGSVGKMIVDRYEAGFAKPAPKTESYSVSFEGMTKK